MYFLAPTIDDLLNEVFGALTKLPFNIHSTRSEELGPTSEILGALLEIENPRCRLSRTETKGKIFSALGELFWYLSAKNDLDFITYYLKNYAKESEDDKTVYGGYGPRLFNSNGRYNQVENVLRVLKNKPTSKKVAIQIFEARDIAEPHPEIPCTCTMQFLIRENSLHMITFMRSNDAFIGLPHDVFAFTMLQEILAVSLGVDMGRYIHSVGSLHMYQSNKEAAEQYLNEGIQSTKKPMPEMPKSDPWPAIRIAQDIEQNIRLGKPVDIENSGLDDYWTDLMYLLKLFSIFKTDLVDAKLVKDIQQKLSTNVYDVHINQRLESSKHIL